MSNTIGAANAGWRKSMPAPDCTAGAAVGRFYDHMWHNTLSSGALAHGATFIGQECLLTADELLAFARLAGIGPDTFVLDIGSGTGGPACYLAQQLGCRVLGLDISAVGHARATTRVQEQGLHHLVEFRHGDVLGLDLPAASVDVVLALDAWCHIPRRPALLQRCATWLRSGGRLAFYDQVERHPLPAEARQHFLALWHFPGLETPRSYLAAIKAAGLQVDFEIETSFNAARFYTRLLEAYKTQQAAIETVRGPERYHEELARLQMTQHFTAFGMLGQMGCIALKPADH